MIDVFTAIQDASAIGRGPSRKYGDGLYGMGLYGGALKSVSRPAGKEADILGISHKVVGIEAVATFADVAGNKR